MHHKTTLMGKKWEKKSYKFELTGKRFLKFSHFS